MTTTGKHKVATSPAIPAAVEPIVAKAPRTSKKRGMDWFTDLITSIQFLGGLAIGLIMMGSFFTIEYFKLSTDEEVDSKIAAALKPIEGGINNIQTDLATLKDKGLDSLLKAIDAQRTSTEHLELRIEDLHNDIGSVKIDVANLRGSVGKGR